MSLRRVMIVCPYWRARNHVGMARVARFVRWLRDAGREVVIVRPGHADGIQEGETGTEILIRDPLGVTAVLGPAAEAPIPRPVSRAPSRLRRAAAVALLVPDPVIAWSLRVARSPLVARVGADWVLSSSPPESPHIGAAGVARRLNARLCLDLRDGWVDEPLREHIATSRIRGAFERWLERRTLTRAARIFVTSEVWRDDLVARYPQFAERVTVLTNGYDADVVGAMPAATVPRTKLTLVYAGRFTGSRHTQRVELLLEPLLAAARTAAVPATIRLVGRLEARDASDAAAFAPRFAALGWTLETPGEIPREAVAARLAEADGLLVLCASRAALPSKMFEYIPARRPVFVAAAGDSAVARLCVEVPQAFVATIGDAAGSAQIAERYLAAILAGAGPTAVPARYAPAALGRVFLDALDRS